MYITVHHCVSLYLKYKQLMKNWLTAVHHLIVKQRESSGISNDFKM